jgi:hypothetical protein
MAKKPKKLAKQRAAKASATKASTPKSIAAKGSAAPAATPNIVVFYELHGLAGIRYHSEYGQIERARLAAQNLVSSPDVDQAWVVQGVEIFQRGG